MSTSNGGDTCMLGWLLDHHNSETYLLYAHDIPGQAAFPFCCWAGLKSVSRPKMKPHTGLHAGWQVQTCFQQWGTVFFLQVFIVLCKVPCEPDTKQSLIPVGAITWRVRTLRYNAVPFRITEGAIECFAFGCGQDRCVYLRPVWLYTWLGSREEQQAPSGSYSCPLSRKHRDMFV